MTEAEGSLRRAVQCDPSSLPAHVYLGLNLRAQGRLAEAAAELQAVLQADPGNIEAARNLREITAQRAP